MLDPKTDPIFCISLFFKLQIVFAFSGTSFGLNLTYVVKSTYSPLEALVQDC